MFELTIALRYLLPRRKSLSTALVSLLSVGVISLVVWLVLVFLSVTNGIESNWLKKLTALHAPIRLTPTERYFNSYYYQADSLSAASNYTLKTIGEKATSSLTDPYFETSDAEAPSYWPSPDRKEDGEVRDIVKETYAILDGLQVPYQDYEIGGALLKLSLSHSNATGGGATLSQMSYLLSLPEKNPEFASLLLPPSPEDLGQAALIVDGHCQLRSLPSGESVLLPKSYRDIGVHIGDRGSLSFSAFGATTAQEQRITIQVAGFYDPGLFSLGGRCLIVPSSVTRTIHAASQTFSPDGTPTNGIFVWDLAAKEKIEARLSESGLLRYWKVDTYRDFEFSKELFQQFESDKTLFLLIAILILFVACCNIISLLILLVNDKKREIAILQAMGASGKSIALIFGFCGLIVGVLSSLIGTCAAIFTLRHLDTLVHFLSSLQGHVAFQPAFFGQSLPNQLSGDALFFIIIATPLLSLLAGLIPALKARRIRASLALRQE